MKKLDYYLSLPYRIELYEDTEAGGYSVTIPELPGVYLVGRQPNRLLKILIMQKKSGYWLHWRMDIPFQNQQK